ARTCTLTTQQDVDSGDKHDRKTWPCAEKLNGNYKKDPDLKSGSGQESAPTPESEQRPGSQGGPPTPSGCHVAARTNRAAADVTTEQSPLARIPEQIPCKAYVGRSDLLSIAAIPEQMP
ncbi:unnamed protein product, partial [Lymnaea stagnalis]